MRIKCVLAAAALIALSMGGASANAAIITYYGADNGVGPGARPNADAAAAAFDLALSGLPLLIDFESGTLANPAPGVTLALAGQAGGGLQNTDQHAAPEPLGYNTTAGGNKWLQLWPAFNSAGSTATFTFGPGINAFGAYFTDTQVGFPGTVAITFNDGSAQNLSFTKNNDTGGVLFFGFTDFGTSFTSVAISTGTTGNTRDIWGVDDVRYAPVPEPGTLALLGLGLSGFAASRRRKK